MIDSSKPTRIVLLALLVLVALAYSLGLGGGFIFDDRPNIFSNTAVQVTSLRWDDWVAAILSSPAANFPRPMAMFSFALNHYFTGLDPVAMKATNIAIHLFNTLLVFQLARLLIHAANPGQPREASLVDWAPLFVAAAWSLNPINLMAVLYVVQRMESLCHVFVFSGLWLYVQGRLRMLRGQNGWHWIVTGLLLFAALGALSKESAMLLPLYGFCLEICLFRFRGAHAKSRQQLAVFYAVFLFLPSLLALARLLPPALGPNPFPGRDFNLVERLLTEPRILIDYLQWTIYPNLQQMSIYQDAYPISRGLFDPVSTILAILALAGMAIFALWIRKRRPLLALGLLWFLAAHVITATIIPLELVFEHRNYFASFGVCIALADLLLLWPVQVGRRKVGAALAALLVLMGGLGTALRSWEWRDPLAFAISEAGKHPDSPRAIYALGVALSNIPDLKGDSPLAIAAFDSFDRARQLPRSNILPDQAAIMLASKLELPVEDEWWSHMQSRLRERPLGPQETAALASLGNCAIESRCSFPVDAMMATFQAALSQGPNAEVESIMGGYFLTVLRQPDMALFLWHGASERIPREPQYRISVIKLLIALRRYEEAADELQQLRNLGRFGQHHAVADKLAIRLAQAESTYPAAPPPP